MHLSHVYHGTFAAFRRFIHLSVCLCAGTFREKSKYSRECFWWPSFPCKRDPYVHLKINASQHQQGRKTGECFSGRGDLKSLCHFLYEVRLHDVIMDSLHARYGNSLMAFECRKNPNKNNHYSSHKQKQWALLLSRLVSFQQEHRNAGPHIMRMVRCRSVWL